MDNPQLYDSSSDLPRIQNAKRIPEFVSQMKWTKSEKILEIGCGPGFSTKHQLLPELDNQFSDPTRHVYAIDSCGKMIGFASEKYRHEQVTYSVGDIMDEQFGLGFKFNKIFTFNVLHHIEDHEKLFRKLYHLLEENGEVALYFPAQSLIFDVYEKISKVPKWAPYHADIARFVPKTHHSGTPAKMTGELMQKAGFRVHDERDVREPFRFKNKQVAIDFYTSINPFVSGVPGDLREEYKKEVGLEFISRLTPAPTSTEPDGLGGDRLLVVLRAEKLSS